MLAFGLDEDEEIDEQTGTPDNQIGTGAATKEFEMLEQKTGLATHSSTHRGTVSSLQAAAKKLGFLSTKHDSPESNSSKSSGQFEDKIDEMVENLKKDAATIKHDIDTGNYGSKKGSKRDSRAVDEDQMAEDE